MEATTALRVRKESSAQEKVNLLYSLHSLDYTDINFYSIWYLTA